MAVQDLWRDRHGKPTSRDGRGKRWRVVVPGQSTRSFHAKTDAAAWERHLWQQAQQTIHGPATTIEALVALWLAGKQGLSEGGLQQCKDAALRVNDRWGPMLPSEVMRADVQAWIASLTVAVKRRTNPREMAVWVERPASHTVRSKAIQCLGGALRIAQEHGHVQSVVTDQVKIPKQEKRRPRVLTVRELAALAGECEMPDAVWLLGTSGVRVSEAMRLTVGSVDPKTGRVVISDTKNREPRDVVIPELVVGMLDLARGKDEPLLVHPRGLNTDRRSFRQHILLPAAKRAGISNFTTHHLRHTAVSLAIHSGADIKVVQKMAGHKSATMTWDTYGHMWEDSLELVAKRMGEAIMRELQSTHAV